MFGLSPLYDQDVAVGDESTTQALRGQSLKLREDPGLPTVDGNVLASPLTVPQSTQPVQQPVPETLPQQPSQLPFQQQLQDGANTVAGAGGTAFVSQLAVGETVINKETGIAPRRCTDIGYCFCFLLFILTMCTILTLSRFQGNVYSLMRGRDYYGRVCGIENGVENSPWLFWCRSEASTAGVPNGIQTLYPTCVQACPVSYTSMNISCLRKGAWTVSPAPVGAFDNVKAQMVQFQESIVATAPYPTRPRGGRFCLPQDDALANQLLESWDALHPLGHIMRNVNVGTLGHLYWLFALTTIVSIVLGYIFLLSTRFCSKALARIFCYPAATFMACGTVYFLLAIFPLMNKTGGFSEWYMARSMFYEHYTIAIASILSFIGFIVCAAVSLLLFGMAYNFNANLVSDLIHASMDCLKTVPFMYLLPAVEALLKLFIFIFYIDGLRWFFSVGDLQKNRILVNGVRFAGLSREWGWDHWYIIVVVAWILGFAWTMEICNAFFQYLISFCVVRYWYIPKDGHSKRMRSCPIPEGAKDAIIYHFGSIVSMAYFLPQWRPIRLIYWLTSEVMPQQERKDKKSLCSHMMACLPCSLCGGCCGLHAWAKTRLGLDRDGGMAEDSQPVVKDGLTDIVIRANDFIPGCNKAQMLLSHSHKAVQHFYRDLSSTTLCILGVGVIACTNAFVVFCIVSFEPSKPSTFGYILGYNNPMSQYYIASPLLVVILSWILSAYIVYGFMSTWEHTAHTLLYCYTWNRRYARASVDKFIPETVRCIVGTCGQCGHLHSRRLCRPRDKRNRRSATGTRDRSTREALMIRNTTATHIMAARRALCI